MNGIYMYNILVILFSIWYMAVNLFIRNNLILLIFHLSALFCPRQRQEA